MVAQTKDQVTEKDDPVQQDLFLSGDVSGKPEVQKDQTGQDQKPPSAADLRSASYFVLTLGAIFVINAMETGSYRTPWPVALVVSLVGLALLVYSIMKARRENSDG